MVTTFKWGARVAKIHFSEFRILTSDKINSKNELENFWSKIRQTQETWAFEQMSYLLFCAEFNNRVGLFRYKNQTGIETEPIEKDGKYYGFQPNTTLTQLRTTRTTLLIQSKKQSPKTNN